MTFDDAVAVIESGDEDRLAEILEEKPGLVHETGGSGMSLLMLALYHRQAGCVERLVECRELTLFEAAAVGRVERLRQLLDEEGTDVDDRSSDGFSALHLAAFFGHVGVVGELLSRGATANSAAGNPSAVQPLHSAVAGGSGEVVQSLLRAGAEVDARQTGGHTPLMSAAANGRDETVDALLASGADRALTNDEGQTAADLASSHGQDSLAERLRPSVESI